MKEDIPSVSLRGVRPTLACVCRAYFEPLLSGRGRPLIVLSALLFVLFAPPPSGQSVTTQAGEWRQTILSEGSILLLAPDSQLTVKLGEENRRVVLSSGEVTFTVAKDPRRPFIVSTRVVDVHAAGTERIRHTAKPALAVDSKFVVRVDRGVEVEVFEGVVEISRREAKPGSQVIRLSKGDLYRSPGEVVADVLHGSGAGLFDG